MQEGNQIGDDKVNFEGKSIIVEGSLRSSAAEILLMTFSDDTKLKRMVRAGRVTMTFKTGV